MAKKEIASISNIEVGQVWKDCDPRGNQPNFLVIGIDAKTQKAEVFRIDTRRRVKIRLDRFFPTATGYALKGMAQYIGVG